MILTIDDDYQITSDKYNVAILQKVIRVKGVPSLDKHGDMSYSTVGYYPSVNFALKAYVKQSVIDKSEKLTLEQYLTALAGERLRVAHMLHPLD